MYSGSFTKLSKMMGHMEAHGDELISYLFDELDLSA